MHILVYSKVFKLGQVVEYFSASQGSWIPAKAFRLKEKGSKSQVVAVKDQSYDLDCCLAKP